MKIYAIRTTNGQYLRAEMRMASEGNLREVLVDAADYIGAEGVIEFQDGGDVVLGPLVASEVGS